jgi:hypothetical protein
MPQQLSTTNWRTENGLYVVRFPGRRLANHDRRGLSSTSPLPGSTEMMPGLDRVLDQPEGGTQARPGTMVASGDDNRLAAVLRSPLVTESGGFAERVSQR